MAIEKDIAALQSCITNKLEPAAIDNRRLAGVIGDAPSQYSKSPSLWNAAFRLLGMKAIYLPLDVDQERLKELAGVQGL